MDSTKPRLFKFHDVVKHRHLDDCWLLINGKVYNVTEYLNEHPGGDEVLVGAAENDATDDFEDVGHSKDAKEIMNKYYIGDIDPASIPSRNDYKPHVDDPKKHEETAFPIKLLHLLLPLLILGVAFAAKTALK